MPKDYPFSAFFGQADVTFTVPSSVEDFDNTIGESGAALDEANDNIIYRHTAPRLYGKVSDALANTAGSFKFPKEQAKNKDGTPAVRTTKAKGDVPIMEADMAHLSRYYETGDDTAKAALLVLLQSTASSLPFYDKTTAPARGPAKVSKGSLDAANGFVAKGADSVEAVITKIEGYVPGYKVSRDEDGSVTAESLGRAIDALGKFQQQKAKAEAAALLV